jgi:hypothetical protein
MTKKVLIVGGDKSPLLLQKLMEEHGKDISVYTPEEALESGLTMEDFGNLPTMKITAPQILPEIILPNSQGDYPNGRSNRRERRKKDRQNKL